MVGTRPRDASRFYRELPIWFLVALVGCNAEPSGLYHVSGTIDFNGQPVPAGTILFQPDGSHGAKGPAGIALIRDGKYNTAGPGGKGVVGGPHRVRITGLDGKPVAMGPEGVPLFPDYSTTIDLPTEDTTHDFSVPQNGRSR
ncbi:MAG: hypothetical protein WDZ51_05030 [Pirellulaceae bacterium]